MDKDIVLKAAKLPCVVHLIEDHLLLIGIEGNSDFGNRKHSGGAGIVLGIVAEFYPLLVGELYQPRRGGGCVYLEMNGPIRQQKEMLRIGDIDGLSVDRFKDLPIMGFA